MMDIKQYSYNGEIDIKSIARDVLGPFPKRYRSELFHLIWWRYLEASKNKINIVTSDQWLYLKSDEYDLFLVNVSGNKYLGYRRTP